MDRVDRRTAAQLDQPGAAALDRDTGKVYVFAQRGLRGPASRSCLYADSPWTDEEMDVLAGKEEAGSLLDEYRP